MNIHVDMIVVGDVSVPIYRIRVRVVVVHSWHLRKMRGR